MNSFKRIASRLEPFYPLDDPAQLQECLDKELESRQAQEQSKQLRHLAAAAGLTVRIILYLPSSLVLKPLLLVWVLVTIPFSYFFDDSVQETPSMTSIEASVEQKTEMLKQERILANHVKLPSLLSRYIIPPPPRLFPLLRNPERKRRKKTLILDLDETLIHSLSRGAPRLLSLLNAMCQIELKINGVLTLYYVYKRPYCDFFLREIAKWFDLQIFTASVKEYADPIIDWLESEIIDHKEGEKQVFSKRYYRTDCTYRKGLGYIKDLSKFFKEEDLKNVLILDNSPVSYAMHENNAVTIEGWINDLSDRDLLHLLPMLHSLSLCIDVRFVLGLRSGEKLFENL